MSQVLKEYIEVELNIAKLEKVLKPLKQKKKELTPKVLAFVKETRKEGSKGINIKHVGDINVNSRKSKAPINQDFLLEKLSIVLPKEQAEETADNIFNKREVKTSEILQFKPEKAPEETAGEKDTVASEN